MRIGSLSRFIYITQETKKQFEKLSLLIRMASSGKRVDLYETEPSGVYEVLSTKSTIAKLRAYEDNIRFAKGFLLTADDTLGKIYDVTLKIKEKLVQAANSQSDYETLKDELTELKNRLEQLLKTKIGDYYIFAGNEPTTVPVDDNDKYAGGDDHFYVKVSDTDKVPVFINVNPFVDKNDDDKNILKVIQNSIDNITDKDTIENNIQKVENLLNTIDQVRGYVGANEQKLEQYADTYSELIDNLKKKNSDLEGVDVARAITDYKQANVTYQSLLQILGKENTTNPILLKYF
jgi:flagellin-like hook-associated protein FlgL